MNTQYRKNLKAVLETSKNYTDKEVKKAKDELITFFSRNTVDTDDHTNELAYQITAPAGAKLLQLQAIGGNTVKLSPSVASDSTKAMIKTMPATVYDFDGSKFYGDSEVSENLIVLNDVAETTLNGITYSVKDGVITLNGTTTIQYWAINLSIPTLYAGTYYGATFATNNPSNSTIYLGSTQSFNGNITTTTTYTNIRVYIHNENTSVNNWVIRPMLVKGSTAPTEWKQGFEGIHNIELTGIRSEGVNLANADLFETGAIDLTTGGDIYRNDRSRSNYIAITPYTQYTLKWDNNNINYVLYDENKTKIGNGVGGTFNVGVAKYIRFYSSLITESTQIMFNEGSTALPYEPYVSTTKTIDLSTILYNGSPLFEDNKMLKDDVLTPYKATKGGKKLILNGTEDWYVNDAWSSASNISIYTGLSPVGLSNVSAVITKDFTNAGSSAVNSTSVDQYRIGSVIYLNFTASGGKINEFTLAKAKEWLTNNNVEIDYPLATPIEVSIDWSAILRNIQGYPNGSIIAENTYNMDVESVITYNSIIQETLCPSITITRNGVEVETRNLPTITSDGYGVNADAHNLRVFSDYEGNAVSKRYTNVDKNILGDDTWEVLYGGTANEMVVSYDISTNVVKPSVSTDVANILTTDFTTASVSDVYTHQQDNITAIGTTGTIAIYSSLLIGYSASVIKTSLANNPLYYELNDNSKTETDMDDFDYFFDVEEGDVITFNNPYAQQVYATYSFIIKEAKSNE